MKNNVLLAMALLFSSGLILMSSVDNSHELTKPYATPSCGFYVTSAIQKNLLRMTGSLAKASLTRMNRPKTFGIQFYVTSTNYKSSGAAVQRNALETAIRQANRHFNPMNIKFVLCDVKYIDKKYHDYNFSSKGSSRENDMGKKYYTSSRINVFVVNKSSTSWSNFPVVSSDDWILMNRGQLTNNSTFTHELGHYFGLLHTHESKFGRERANKSNCAIAGDLICDTPADPNLSSYMRGCGLTKSIGYKPDLDNLMSYAPAGCRKSFTRQQKARIVFFANTSRSNKKYCR